MGEDERMAAEKSVQLLFTCSSVSGNSKQWRPARLFTQYFFTV